MSDEYDKSMPGEPGAIVARAGRRLAVQRSAWLNDWYISYSPRNDNQNAEGDWAEWVALAREILAADASRHLASGGPVPAGSYLVGEKCSEETSPPWPRLPSDTEGGK